MTFEFALHETKKTKKQITKAEKSIRHHVCVTFSFLLYHARMILLFSTQKKERRRWNNGKQCPFILLFKRIDTTTTTKKWNFFVKWNFYKTKGKKPKNTTRQKKINEAHPTHTKKYQHKNWNPEIYIHIYLKRNSKWQNKEGRLLLLLEAGQQDLIRFSHTVVKKNVKRVYIIYIYILSLAVLYYMKRETKRAERISSNSHRCCSFEGDTVCLSFFFLLPVNIISKISDSIRLSMSLSAAAVAPVNIYLWVRVCGLLCCLSGGRDFQKYIKNDEIMAARYYTMCNSGNVMANKKS